MAFSLITLFFVVTVLVLLCVLVDYQAVLRIRQRQLQAEIDRLKELGKGL